MRFSDRCWSRIQQSRKILASQFYWIIFKYRWVHSVQKKKKKKTKTKKQLFQMMLDNNGSAQICSLSNSVLVWKTRHHHHSLTNTKVAFISCTGGNWPLDFFKRRFLQKHEMVPSFAKWDRLQFPPLIHLMISRQPIKAIYGFILTRRVLLKCK